MRPPYGDAATAVGIGTGLAKANAPVHTSPEVSGAKALTVPAAQHDTSTQQ